MPYGALVERTVPVSRAKLYSLLVDDFGEMKKIMGDAVESCTLEGDVRTLAMMGIEIKEQLRSCDDGARRITYSVIESPMDNLKSHTATIAVDPEGGGTHVTWSVAVDPDELLGLFVPVYEGSLAEMKKQLEG